MQYLRLLRQILAYAKHLRRENVNVLLKFAGWVDKLNEKAGAFTGWLSALMVLIVCYDVFTRYLLNSSSIAVQELEWHLFAVIFLLGAAYTLKHDRHVRVDVLYHNFSPKNQAWVNFLGSLFFLIPFVIMVLITSSNFVTTSFRINETSPDPGGLPARFVLKACLPLGFILLLLQGIALMVRSLETILKPRAQTNLDNTGAGRQNND